MAELEAVMTVELQIRGPYPIGEQRLAVNIESGSLLGFGAFEGKLSGSVIAPSGDVIVVQKTGTFEIRGANCYKGLKDADKAATATKAAIAPSKPILQHRCSSANSLGGIRFTRA